jgi:hypothetical protein
VRDLCRYASAGSNIDLVQIQRLLVQTDEDLREASLSPPGNKCGTITHGQLERSVTSRLLRKKVGNSASQSKQREEIYENNPSEHNYVPFYYAEKHVSTILSHLQVHNFCLFKIYLRYELNKHVPNTQKL